MKKHLTVKLVRSMVLAVAVIAITALSGCASSPDSDSAGQNPNAYNATNTTAGYPNSR